MKQVLKQLFAICLLSGLAQMAQAQKLAVSNMEVTAGDTATFVVNLKDGRADAYNALTLTLQFEADGFELLGEPEFSSRWVGSLGILQNDDDAEYLYTPIYAMGLQDNQRSTKVVVASPCELPGTAVDSLLTFRFKVDADVEEDSYYINLKNILFEYAPDGKDYANAVSFWVYVVNNTPPIPTSIAENVNSAADHRLYDLQGRRIDKAPRKGIYLRNGKKVVIRRQSY